MEPLQQSDLAQFTGTENYYTHSPGFYYTDGVKFIADRAGAYWLIDAIASHQKTVRAFPWSDLQFWDLQVDDNRAVLTCSEDAGIPPVVTQEIEYTDFPFSIRLWVGLTFLKGGGDELVLLLPSEW